MVCSQVFLHNETVSFCTNAPAGPVCTTTQTGAPLGPRPLDPAVGESPGLASLTFPKPLALWTILRRHRRLYLRAHITHALASGACIRCKLERCHVFLHAWLQSWHGQDENPIAVR